MIAFVRLALFLFVPGSLSYNTYPNSKRYGGSGHRLHSYDPYSYQAIMAQKYPVNYYKVYPYSENYPDDYYYPQESYPMYYPPARTSKYEIYQAVLPYYYQQPYNRPNYNYGYDDPVVDLQDEVQEAEREEREEAQPIGHESFYENDGDDNRDATVADINAAFLQNLILSQMYQDSLDNDKQNYNVYNGYDEPSNAEEIKEQPIYPREDENVRELKELPKKQRNRQLRKQRQRKQKQEEKRSELDINYIPDNFRDAMVYTDRKPVIKMEMTTTTEIPKVEIRGQKEEFQMRPATPVRHPFASPVLAMMSNNEKEKKRMPSVYDTIKHMLDMEKGLELENSPAASDLRPAMKKRIITPEENLTRQLTVLKKAQ